MKRIGMLTSGGDCQALNAAMRGVVKTMMNSEEEVEYVWHSSDNACEKCLELNGKIFDSIDYLLYGLCFQRNNFKKYD